MKKRYTVTWQDGKPASIEVDGVRYGDALEITDRRDRAAVLRLLSRPPARRGELFNDAEFEADVHRLERETAGVPRIVVAIFLGVAVLMLIIAVVSGVYTARNLTREVSAPGWVAAVTSRSDSNGYIYYYPVVDFVLADGTSYSLIVPEGSSAGAYRVGQEITVRYDPERPESARIDSLGGTALQWLVTLITGFIGLVFLVVSLAVAWFLRDDAAGERDA